MRVTRRLALAGMLCLCLLLGGCAALKLEGEPVSSKPNLDLLAMEAYEEDAPAQTQRQDAGVLRVDLWLDASQVMGGINPVEDGLYPHFSRRYREGGFHYRYEGDVGWYEAVLRDMLAVAEDSLTRVIRFGNERIPDEYIINAGLAKAGDNELLRSLRRDLLTYAVSPMPSVFQEMSAEDMTDSFYTLGTTKLNQMARFASGGGAELENPGRVAEMNRLLDAQISSIAGGGNAKLLAVGDDTDYPLLYALDNIDLSRLSVITFDPAGLRRLSGTTSDGEGIDYIQSLLAQRGVYDAGLSAGLYAFTLDYMGQMSSFGAADLAEPLLWGRLKYSSAKNRAVAALPMPRVLLTLVIGQPEHVSQYAQALAIRLNTDTALKGMRGPTDGELIYTALGQQVTQQPFSFAYEYTAFERPSVECLTQHTQDMSIAVSDGGELSAQGSLQTVVLPLDKQPRTLTVSFPLLKSLSGLEADMEALQNAGLEIVSSLLLTRELPNDKDTQVPQADGAQVITVRDTVYVFENVADTFAAQPETSPFTLLSIQPGADADRLEAQLSVDAAKLKPGYYRLMLSADLSGQQLTWPRVDWIDGSKSLNASITNDQIVTWESFAALIHQFDGAKDTIPRQLQHAWGAPSERDYHGMAYPDFPPVYRALGLRELADQLRDAANIDTLPYIRCVFDVFVDSGL